VAARDELGRLEQPVEVVADDHPGRAERRIGRPRLPGERPGMGDRRRLGLPAPADLDGHDRLADLEGPVGEGEEQLRPLEALDEEDHGLGLVVVDRVGEEVAHVEDDLAAAADDPREADPVAGVDERVCHRSRLGDPRDAAPGLPRVHVADVRGAVRRPVHEAHAVGPEQRDPVTDREVADIDLHPCGGLAALDDSPTRNDHRPHAGRGGVRDDRTGTERVHRDDDRIGDLGQVGDRRIAGLAVELLVARVDEVAARRRAHDPQVVPDRLGDPSARGCADDRDRARGEQRPEVDRRMDRAGWHRRPLDRRRRGGLLGGHPTTRPTPRFSRARATIIRWISDVPSQIRSARSSRR
jgi:hypothetical protein